MLNRSLKGKLAAASLAVALALCFLPAAAARGPARDGAAESSDSREGRLRIFDEVWEQVRARYFDPALGGVDWPALRREMRPLAAEARGEREFYAVLRDMLGRLRDPHTRVFAPGENGDWRVLRFVSVGVSVRELAGEVVVTQVERGSAAWRAGVRPGDAVKSVEGVPSVLLGPAPARPFAAARVFDGPAGSPVNVVFASGGGRERSVRLVREERTRTPALEARREGGVGVVRFNVFAAETAAALVRALKAELAGSRALVVDLRDNGGGETEAMTDAASALLPSGLSLGRFNDRGGRVRLEPFTRSAALSSAAPLARFDGPVVVLTGARTASAAEILAAALKERGRARLVGEKTCGCVLAIRNRHELPDGGILDISELDYHTAAGSRLEGSGVAPDEPLAPTREDLRRGRDRAMKRAVEILKLMIKR